MARRPNTGRIGTRAVLILLVAVAIAGYAWAGLWFKQELESRIVRVTENQLWAIFQMQKEVLQTLRSMERMIDGDLTVNTDDLILDYDILISRVNLVANGRRYQELRKLEALNQLLDDLSATIGVIDLDIEKAGRYPPVVAKLIYGNLKPYEQRLERTIAEVVHFVSDRSDTYNIETVRLLTLLQWAIVGNAFILILTLLFLYRVISRAYQRRAREDREWFEQQYREESLRHAKDLTLAMVLRGLIREIRRPIKKIASNLTSLQEHFSKSAAVPGAAAGTIGMTNADIRENLRQMERANARSLELVRGLRRFAEPEDDAEPSVTVSTAIDRAVLLLSKADSSSKIQVTTKNNLPTVPGRRDVLVHVLINLIITVKHCLDQDSKSTGRTTITACQDAGVISIRVHDVRLEIPQEIIELVRWPDHLSMSMDLGDWQYLAVCPAIVAAEFKGSVEVEDDANVGQAIVIKLPLNTAA